MTAPAPVNESLEEHEFDVPCDGTPSQDCDHPAKHIVQIAHSKRGGNCAPMHWLMCELHWARLLADVKDIERRIRLGQKFGCPFCGTMDISNVEELVVYVGPFTRSNAG